MYFPNGPENPSALPAGNRNRTPRQREYGLDSLRAAAIALVFMYHYTSFVSHEPTFGFLSVIGWTGVDLFFVLSGYLIANQLLPASLGIKRYPSRNSMLAVHCALCRPIGSSWRCISFFLT
jgi:surface polysaccharide O-acyltransferase-like enzyme